MHCHTQCSRPCRWPPSTHGDSWTLTGKSQSVLWGQCSFLLGPGTHKFLFVPSKSLFPQSCVSSGGSMVGLMVTSSKRAYAIPRSAAPRAPAAGHCWPVPPQETLKHSKAGLAHYLWSLLLCTGFAWALRTSLADMRFDSKHDFTPPTDLLRPLLCPWMWGTFFWWDPTFLCRQLFSNEF